MIPKSSPDPDDQKAPVATALNYGPLAAIVVTLLAYLGSQLFAGAIIGTAASLMGYDAAQTVDMVEDSVIWQFAFILMVEVISLSALLWFLRRRRVRLEQIGLGRKPRLSDIGYAAVTFGLYFVFLIAVLAAVEALLPTINLDQEQQIGFDDAKGAGALALVFVSLVILPPIVEEIMIRGFLYSGLKTKLPQITAAISASLIFAAAHLQLGSGAPPLWVAAIDTFVLSMILIALRERTGALWSGMLVHGLKNGLAFVSLFILHTV